MQVRGRQAEFPPVAKDRVSQAGILAARAPRPQPTGPCIGRRPAGQWALTVAGALAALPQLCLTPEGDTCGPSVTSVAPLLSPPPPHTLHCPPVHSSPPTPPTLRHRLLLCKYLVCNTTNSHDC